MAHILLCGINGLLDKAAAPQGPGLITSQHAEHTED